MNETHDLFVKSIYLKLIFSNKEIFPFFSPRFILYINRGIDFWASLMLGDIFI